MSGGEQQMLAIGRALMSGPRLLMLDEPSMGLAPLLVKEIFASIRRLNDDGLTLLIAEQNANLTLKIADYGYVLQDGFVATRAPRRRCAATRACAPPTWANDEAGSPPARRRRYPGTRLRRTLARSDSSL